MAWLPGRTVRFAVFRRNEGGENVEFYCDFKRTYLNGFLSYDVDQEAEKYFRAQENRLLRTQNIERGRDFHA